MLTEHRGGLERAANGAARRALPYNIAGQLCAARRFFLQYRHFAGGHRDQGRTDNLCSIRGFVLSFKFRKRHLPVLGMSAFGSPLGFPNRICALPDGLLFGGAQDHRLPPLICLSNRRGTTIRQPCARAAASYRLPSPVTWPTHFNSAAIEGSLCPLGRRSRHTRRFTRHATAALTPAQTSAALPYFSSRLRTPSTFRR
jgi:hypothetical protein